MFIHNDPTTCIYTSSAMGHTSIPSRPRKGSPTDTKEGGSGCDMTATRLLQVLHHRDQKNGSMEDYPHGCEHCKDPGLDRMVQTDQRIVLSPVKVWTMCPVPTCFGYQQTKWKGIVSILKRNPTSWSCVGLYHL